MNKFHGVGPALVTPFTENGDLDLKALERLVSYVSENGVDYLVVQGTTGESPTLTKDEKDQVLKTVIASNKNGLPIVFGLGGNNTKVLTEQLRANSFEGIDAFLSVCPYYNKPSQEGIYRHFMALADSSPKPIILYNVPSRTGSNIQASTTARLSQHPNIIGIKEASGDLEQAISVKNLATDGFLLISGEDLLTVPMISSGAVGVISVLANGFPEVFSRMIHDAQNGDFKSAQLSNQKFLGINPLMYEEGNPVGVKVVLEERGICTAQVRLPMARASKKLQERIREETKKAAL